MSIDSNTANIFTVVGTIVTILGFMITVGQLVYMQWKNTKFQSEVQQEVQSAQLKIRSGLSISKVPKASQYIKDAIHFMHEDKNEIAAMRMEDAETLLDEILRDDCFASEADKNSYEDRVKDFKESLRSLQSNMNSTLLLNTTVIMNHLSRMNSVLSEISSNQIDSLWQIRQKQ